MNRTDNNTAVYLSISILPVITYMLSNITKHISCIVTDTTVQIKFKQLNLLPGVSSSRFLIIVPEKITSSLTLFVSLGYLLNKPLTFTTCNSGGL